MFGVKVVSGDVITNSNTYATGSTTWNAGDLVRIDTVGTVELATTTAAGGIHAIALGDSADYAAGEKVPLAMLKSDTILAVPTEAGNAPEDYTVGVGYGLVVTTQAQTADLSATTGQLICVGKQSDDLWFDPDVDETEDGTQYIYCRVSQVNLDTRAA
jgi:hypothetical protein